MREDLAKWSLTRLASLDSPFMLIKVKQDQRTAKSQIIVKAKCCSEITLPRTMFRMAEFDVMSLGSIAAVLMRV